MGNQILNFGPLLGFFSSLRSLLRLFFFFFPSKVIHRYFISLNCCFVFGVGDIYLFDKPFTAFGERGTPNIPLIDNLSEICLSTVEGQCKKKTVIAKS